MPGEPLSAADQTVPPEGGESGAPALTPELVKEVTEKVYALLLADLRIEQERQRLSLVDTMNAPGGW